ncbi:unnamed protein product [Soboliphyme baturini]|uniref:Cyclin-like domain-containing protein n=1 Tax=Soboliphyme baturini TaxID=241478 RepID=A0A3P8E664_9BILA|nr:unnamed protein product [Soboliphyme baturini]
MYVLTFRQQWILDRQEILYERAADLRIFSEEEYQKIGIFFTNLIQAIGEQLKVRQQVIATATSIDPLLLSPTCIFLASKVDEFGVISQNKLLTACQSLGKCLDSYLNGADALRFGNKLHELFLVKNRYNFCYQQEFPYRINHILEAEFFLLEMLDCCLIVYHPYRPLMTFFDDLSNDESLISLSWKIINDSLKTDVCLMYAPSQIALACLHMASVMLGKNLNNWFAELSTDMEKILEINHQLLAMYQLWKNFDEKKEMYGLLQRIPKSKSQPSRPPSAAGNSNSQDQLLSTQPTPNS